MSLEEFQNEERQRGHVDIVDPNISKEFAKENSQRMQSPNVDKILGNQPKEHVPMDVRNIAGIQIEKEPEKVDPRSDLYDDIDRAIERKTREAELFSNAIDESNEMGAPLTEEEFRDILKNNKDFIEGDAGVVTAQTTISEAGVENKNGSVYDQDAVSNAFNQHEEPSLEDELAREAAMLEEGDDEIDDGIPMESDFAESNNIIQMPESSVPKKADMDNMSYDDASKMFDDMMDEYDSGDIDYDKELQDLDDNSDKTEQEKINEERTAKLATLIKQKIKPVTTAFDISGFTISKRPAAAQISTPRTKKDKIADWVLMSSHRPIYMREFTGAEIERLANGGKGRTRLNRALDTWNLIYSHIVDPYKPASVEEWAKGVSFLDIDHIYMAIYRANFAGSNFIPYNCAECNEVFLSDDVDIMDMCKFDNAESRKLFDSIIGTECVKEGYHYSTEIVPISDQYAFVFREPSIYNIVFESAVLDEDFVNKFGDMVSFASYIDGIYYINMETHELQPVKTNVYRNNMQKTARARIIKYSQIMSTLNSDQYNTLLAYMQHINKSGEMLTYQLPEVTCPKCKTTIPAAASDASQLVFTRHQLAALATT